MVTTRKTAQSDTGAASASAESKIKPRIIKKYPNRRLYDTQSSSYITLAEVKQLVIDGQPFVVRDAKSGEDLTRSILLQIILEEEMFGVPLFSEAALANIIRFYGHTMQGFMGQVLEKNMQAFMEMQNAWSSMNPVAGLGTMPNFMEQSQAMMQQMQEQMLRSFGLKR